MIIGLYGSPSAGKTSIASKLIADGVVGAEPVFVSADVLQPFLGREPRTAYDYKRILHLARELLPFLLGRADAVIFEGDVFADGDCDSLDGIWPAELHAIARRFGQSAVTVFLRTDKQEMVAGLTARARAGGKSVSESFASRVACELSRRGVADACTITVHRTTDAYQHVIDALAAQP